MGTVYFMIFTILLSCGTYTYSLPVLTPPAAAVLAPDSAAETASNMYGLALLSVIFVPFCNDIIDRHGDVGAVVQVLAAFGVASSAFFLLAFQMESITMLWVGTVVAGAGSQISLNGATAAMAAIFISVDPARAGMINAMYMGGMMTAMPLGALAASFFPLTSYDPRTGEILESDIIPVVGAPRESFKLPCVPQGTNSRRRPSCILSTSSAYRPLRDRS